MAQSRSIIVLLLSSSLLMVLATVGPSTNPLPVAQFYKDQILAQVNLMRSRWELLDSTCDPNAVFSLTYLYMTNALYNTVSSGYFDDGELMSNFTINFASRYSFAIDAWLANDTSSIPMPWREGFNYGASGYSSVQENLVLGMNAHINYDLSGVVDYLNYGTANHKDDYNRINDILTDMAPGVTNDLGSRYDATLLSPMYSALSPAILDLLFGWREGAWQNGVALMNAPTPTARAAVQASIITEAMTAAHTQESYNGGVSTTASRLAYCQANHAPSRL